MKKDMNMHHALKTVKKAKWSKYPTYPLILKLNQDHADRLLILCFDETSIVITTIPKIITLISYNEFAICFIKEGLNATNEYTSEQDYYSTMIEIGKYS